MGKRLFFLGIIIVSAMLLFAGCANKASGTAEADNKGAVQQSSNLTIKVLDVGQGDAILIRHQNQTLLVDTGDIPTRGKLVGYLKKEGITTLDKVIITHPHADHLGGMPGILDAFKVGQIYSTDQTATTALYKQFLTTVKKKSIPFKTVTAGEEIPLTADCSLKILAPQKPYITESEMNNSSIVAKLTYGKFSMLLTGDAETESEDRMVKNYRSDLKSTVLKSGHHGSNTSSSPAFLKAVAPETVVISLGADNEYHHPHPSTLKKYTQAKLNIYRTDTDGTVTITSDGSSYKVEKEKK